MRLPVCGAILGNNNLTESSTIKKIAWLVLEAVATREGHDRRVSVKAEVCSFPSLFSTFETSISQSRMFANSQFMCDIQFGSNQ
eukprot:scaffold233196_cov25-Prasinocladus_malaysianus.AAC.1